MHGFCKCVVVPLWAQLIVLSALDAHNNMTVPVGQNVSLQCPTVSRVSPKQPTVHWEWTGNNHRAPLQLAEGSFSHGNFNARYNIDALRMFQWRLALWRRQRGSPYGRQDDEFTLRIAQVRPSDQGVFTCSLTWENGSRSVSSVLLEVLWQGFPLLVTSAAVTSTVKVVTPSTSPNSGGFLRWVVVPTGLLLASLTVLLVATTRALRRSLLANGAALLDADVAKSVENIETAPLRLPEDHSSPADHTVKHYESMRKIIPAHSCDSLEVPSSPLRPLLLRTPRTSAYMKTWPTWHDSRACNVIRAGPEGAADQGDCPGPRVLWLGGRRVSRSQYQM
ncbi:uncharacterized protein LOC144722751 isoform X1 [Lampetra planeri]